MAICDGMMDYAPVNAVIDDFDGLEFELELGFGRPHTRHEFATNLDYANQEIDLAGKYGVDIRALIQRVLMWNDAEFAGVLRMVALFWEQTGLIRSWDAVLAEIRAELSPTAHERMHYKRRIQDLVNEMMS